MAQSMLRRVAEPQQMNTTGGNDVQHEFLETVLAEYQIGSLGNRSGHHSGNALAGGMRLKCYPP